MKIWTTFIEPMFNIPPRSNASKTDKGKNVHKENGSHIKKVEKEDLQMEILKKIILQHLETMKQTGHRVTVRMFLKMAKDQM